MWEFGHPRQALEGFHFSASSFDSNTGSPIGVTSHSRRKPHGCPFSPANRGFPPLESSPHLAHPEGMTTLQLHLFNSLGLVILVVVAILTRATGRRIGGALAGGAALGVVGLGSIVLGEKVGWWHFAITWEPYFLTLLWIDFALCAFIFLLTWRIARRFGWRGLAMVLVLAALLGPLRDYSYMRRFPEWGAYAPGVAPVLAISATYVLFGVVGHGLMRLVAGPARADRLARRAWEATES